jgi:hypothetical protein
VIGFPSGDIRLGCPDCHPLMHLAGGVRNDPEAQRSEQSPDGRLHGPTNRTNCSILIGVADDQGGTLISRVTDRRPSNKGVHEL